MRSGAETHIRDPAPVGAVMDGLPAGQGEIGYLIMPVTGLPESFTKNVILPAALVFRSLDVSALRYHTLEGAVFLDRQLVGRDVFRT